MIKVSIIIPSLNVVDYIEETLASVTTQSLNEIEIICVDAGSTDGTWEIINSFSKNDKRIICVQSSIKSYGYQVNEGIRLAGGEYIAILESDDYVINTMYEDLYNYAKRFDADYVKSDYATYSTDNDGKRVLVERVISNNPNLYEEIFSPKNVPEVVIDDWYLWNGIYKKEFITKNNILFSESKGAAFQDIGFLHLTASNAERVVYLKESLYRYCVDRADASSNSGKSMKYIRYEYGRLCDYVLGKTSDIEEVMLYKRMIKSFARACAETSNEKMLNNDIVEICDWFQTQLLEAEKKGIITNEDIPYSLREGYKYFMYSAYGLVAYRKLRISEFKSFIDDDKKIVVFGCGNYGKEVTKLLGLYNKNIWAYTDNNADLWGKKIDGIAIVQPNNINDNAKFIVANEKYADRIIKQISELYPKSDIFNFTSDLLFCEG